MKRLFSVILIACLLIGLCGCESKTPQHLALVLLHHSNAPVPDSSHAEDAITQVCASGGSVHIIEGDGDPYLFSSFQVAPPETGVSANTRNKDIQKKLNQLLNAANSCVPLAEQADPLGALDLAGQALAAAEEGEKSIIMIGSGLSCCWPMDMSSQSVCVAELDPQIIVQNLEEAGAIPKYLSGLNIVWYGIGDTCPPQEELGPKDVENLKAIWTAVIRAAGGEVTFPTDLSADIPPVEGLPAVNTVAVQPRETGDMALPEDPVILEGSVAFAGDSHVLTNLDQVDTLLAPLVEVLKQNPDSCLALFGGTAQAGTAEGCRDFGLKRAEAVRDHLISLGVDPGQLIAVGIGWDHPLHIPDLLSDGTLNENVAPQNRVVYMVDAESDTARSLMALFG